MAETTISTEDIRDQGVTADDLNTTTPGKAVITKITASGSNIQLTSSGADAGTGVVDVALKNNLTTSSLTLSGLTAGQVVITDANKKLSSIPYIGGESLRQSLGLETDGNPEFDSGTFASKLQVGEEIIQKDILRPYVDISGTANARIISIICDKFKSEPPGSMKAQMLIHWWVAGVENGSPDSHYSNLRVDILAGSVFNSSSLNHLDVLYTAITDLYGEFSINLSPIIRGSIKYAYIHVEVQGIVYCEGFSFEE